jgi:hypothetical protein
LEKHDPTHVPSPSSKRMASQTTAYSALTSSAWRTIYPRAGAQLCKPELVCVDRENVVNAAVSYERIDAGHGILYIDAIDWICQQLGPCGK